MQIVTDTNFSEILASGKVVVVDFWAPWCGPCRVLSPTVDDVAEEFAGRVTVAKCNVDDCEEIGEQFGIRSIPTLLFFQNGEVADKCIGLVSKAEIVSKINNLL